MSNPFLHYGIAVFLPLLSVSVAYVITPTLWYVVLVTYVMHALFAVPAIYYQTERFFDCAGMVAVLSMLGTICIWHTTLTPRALLLITLCAVWTLRLGLFLFARILQAGSDRRFQYIKKSPSQFVMTWSLSASWTFFTLLAALSAISGKTTAALGHWDILWVVGWITALGIECIADWQKWIFRQQYGRSRFIDTGLWRYSRHPNYVGEIGMWVMVAALSYPSLQGVAYLSLLSPVMVWAMLRYISGVPLLEADADKRFGHLDAYQRYKKTTPCLFSYIQQEKPSE